MGSTPVTEEPDLYIGACHSPENPKEVLTEPRDAAFQVAFVGMARPIRDVSNKSFNGVQGRSKRKDVSCPIGWKPHSEWRKKTSKGVTFH